MSTASSTYDSTPTDGKTRSQEETTPADAPEKRPAKNETGTAPTLDAHGGDIAAVHVDTLTVWSADDPDFAAQGGGALRVPSILPLTSGRLLVVHDFRPHAHADEGWESRGGALPDDLPNPNSLWIRTSDDRGENWTAPRPLTPALAGVSGVSDPCLLQDPNGRVHLFAPASTGTGLFGSHAPTRPAPAPGSEEIPESHTMRLVHAVSDDAGDTWTWEDLTDVALPGGYWPTGATIFPVSGHGVATPDLLLVPCVAIMDTQEDGSRPLSSVALTSRDHGATWQLGAPVPAPLSAARGSLGGSATTGTDENAVVSLEDGTLYMSARDGGYGGRRYTTRSRDGGEHWDAPERAHDLPDPGCNAGLVRVENLLLLTHSAHPQERVSGRLSVSADSGRTWRGCAPLGEDTQRFAYSDLALVGIDEAAGDGERSAETTDEAGVGRCERVVTCVVCAEEPGEEHRGTCLRLLRIRLVVCS